MTSTNDLHIKRLEVNMFPVNCYVLWDDTAEAAIIDMGCFYAKEQQALKNFICEKELKPVHLLNTHLHLDHIFGNAFMGREFGLKPKAHEADAFFIPRTAAYCRMFGFELNEEPPMPEYFLTDGEVIRFGHTELEVIHTPGHSPGGVTFYCRKAGCLFSGDSLFNKSIGRTDLEGGDFNQLRESIATRLFTLPAETKVYPGHGEPTSIKAERMDNPFFR